MYRLFDSGGIGRGRGVLTVRGARWEGKVRGCRARPSRSSTEATRCVSSLSLCAGEQLTLTGQADAQAASVRCSRPKTVQGRPRADTRTLS